MLMFFHQVQGRPGTELAQLLVEHKKPIKVNQLWNMFLIKLSDLNFKTKLMVRKHSGESFLFLIT